MSEDTRHIARDYVEQIAGIGSVKHTWLLEHGREWEYVHDPEWRLPEGIERGEFRNCFQNAAQHVVGFGAVEGYRYVEGTAWCGTIPADHAWLVDENDRVVDPTWIHDGKCGFCMGAGVRDAECDCEIAEEDREYGIECYEEGEGHGEEECFWCHGDGKDPSAQRESSERSYFGVVIESEKLVAHIMRTGTWGCLADEEWYEEWVANGYTS